MVNFNSDVSLPEGRSISPTIFPTASGPRGGRVRPSARSPAPRSPRSDAARCPGPRPSAAPTPRPGCCKTLGAATWKNKGKRWVWILKNSWKMLMYGKIWKHVEIWNFGVDLAWKLFGMWMFGGRKGDFKNFTTRNLGASEYPGFADHQISSVTGSIWCSRYPNSLWGESLPTIILVVLEITKWDMTNP